MIYALNLFHISYGYFLLSSKIWCCTEILKGPPLWLPKAEEYNYWERSISRTLISRCGSQPCHPGCASHRRPGTISLLIRTCTEGALQGGEGPNRANRLLPLAAQQGVHCENRSVLFAQLSPFGSSTRPRSHFPKYKGQQARQLFA